MASTLPPPSSQERMVFVPPQKRTRTASGKTGATYTHTPSKQGGTRAVYGDQILNVQGRGVGSSTEHLETDVLGSMEKLHSLGTMRSIRSNGSIPTLERVRREESNHSIGSHSQTSSGQLSERSTDIDLVREAVHQKRSLRTRKPSNTRVSRGNSRSTSAATSSDELDKISVLTTEERLRNIQSVQSEERLRNGGGIQSRPLPDLPEKEAVLPLPKLQMRINANDEAIEILGPDHVRDECIGGPGVNMTLREGVLETTNERSLLVKNSPGFLTVTGTIKRGKNKGEVFDVQLKMNRDILAKIEKEIQEEKKDQCCCGLNRGIHVLLASMMFIPFLWLFCTLYAFYMGTLTWYNIFIYYNEQRSCCHTVFVSPCVLLLYPVWIMPVTLCLGVYGGITQVSWYWASWRKELGDPEKGFYGWFCNKLSLPDCSPYQVVILTTTGTEDPGTLTSVI